MGSLLPGWNERAPGVVPREFQDFKEDEDEGLGYFASYAKFKQFQKDQGEPSSPIPIGRRSSSLSRRSNPLIGDLQGSPRALVSRSSLPAGAGRDWAPQSPLGDRTLLRAETMAATPFCTEMRPGSISSAGPRGLQRMYSMPLTKGERFDVLAPLSPSSYSSDPRSPNLDAYKTHHADKDKPDYQWWRHLDSAALNEKPDVPESKEKAYIPQYAATGQHLAYHMDDKDSPAMIPTH